MNLKLWQSLAARRRTRQLDRIRNGDPAAAAGATHAVYSAAWKLADRLDRLDAYAHAEAHDAVDMLLAALGPRLADQRPDGPAHGLHGALRRGHPVAGDLAGHSPGLARVGDRQIHTRVLADHDIGGDQ